MSNPTSETNTASSTRIGLGSGLIVVALSMLNPIYGDPAEYFAIAFAFIGLILLVREFCSVTQGWFRWLASAAACSVFVVLWVLTMHSVLARLQLHLRSIGGISAAASPLLNLLGYDTIAERGLVHVQHVDGLVSILPSIEKLGLNYSVLVLSLWFVLHLFAGRRRLIQATMSAVIALVAVTVVRFALATAVYMEYGGVLTADSGVRGIALLSGHVVNALTLCCLGILLDRVLKQRTAPTQSVSDGALSGIGLRSVMCTLLIGAVVGFCLYCEPPGKTKKGRILVDDRFCGTWEPTARLLDQEWYGDFSTYSFGSLTEWLGHWYSVDVNTKQSYTNEYLAGYDILIIKTPVIQIPADEVESIHRFVNAGGGLLLVGDHTNLLGMGTHINTLCSRYGIQFLYDAVSDAKTRGFVDCYGSKLGRPVGSLNVERLKFMTSCSLDIGLRAEPVVVGLSCRRDPHDYAGNSFFGKSGPHPELAHGPAVLAATVRAGKGQIAAFTDSTVWSSFAVFQHDREKLAADLVNQLNHEPSRLRPLLRFLGASIFLIVIIHGVRSQRISELSLWLASLSGLWLGVLLSDEFHAVAYDLGPPNAPVGEVSFLWQGGSCAFPPVLGGIGNLPVDRAFDTLFVTVQRKGLVPRVAWKYEEMLNESTRAVFVLAPVDPPADEVFTELREFVELGGVLVIMDDERLGGRGCAGRYLKEFGAGVQYSPMDSTNSKRWHSHLTGMERISDVPSSDVFVAQRAFGKGRVVYLREASGFSRIGMKHCFARPSASVRQKYDTVFYILDLIPDWNNVDRRFYGIQSPH